MVYILRQNSKKICEGTLADCIDRWQNELDPTPGEYYLFKVEQILTLPMNKDYFRPNHIKEIIKLENKRLIVEYKFVDENEVI